MDRPWDDCRFFVTSGCRNANCKFRHSEAAKKNPTCPSWASGKCKDINCSQKVKDYGPSGPGCPRLGLIASGVWIIEWSNHFSACYRHWSNTMQIRVFCFGMHKFKLRFQTYITSKYGCWSSEKGLQFLNKDFLLKLFIASFILGWTR